MIDLDKIDKFACAMLEAANIDDLFWSIAKNIGEILGFDDCVIYFNDNNHLKQKAAYGIKNPDSRKLLHEIVIKVGTGIVGYVAETGIAEIVADTSLDERYIWDEFSGKSELTVPILYEGVTIAIIDTESSRLNGYTEKDKKLLQIIANIASPRIISAQYCRQLQQTQEQLKETNLQLEDSIDKLKQNQESLVHTEKMASVGVLSAGIAHEINNPLGFSLSNLSVMKEYYLSLYDVHNQLLTQQSLPDNIKKIIKSNQYNEIIEDMDNIINESYDGLIRIKNIVADLCGYVRTKEEYISLFDVNETVKIALNLLRGEIKGNCQLELSLGIIPPLYGNSGKINQVFMNIMLNAIQAIPGSGSIKVATYTDRQNVHIDISDNGSGIKAENIKDIFTPFYTTKPIGEGTGLGLFICYRIITEEHAGQIKVFSGLNGTTFRVMLPLPDNNMLALG